MIYLDNSATTQTDDHCLEILNYYNKEFYFNPSALYNGAEKVSRILQEERTRFAKILNVQPNEIYFTSGGSESNNTVFFGQSRKKGRIIISAGEHPSVYNAAMELKNRGIDVQIAPIHRDASINEQALLNLLTDDTFLVSVIHASNEYGTINDIERICKLVKSKNQRIKFHSDGVQAFCKIPVNLKKLGIDYYSMSAHKLYAPKGIGALYVKSNTPLMPLIYGGGQEKGLRSGTENVGGICAFVYSSMQEMNNLLKNQNNYQVFKSTFIQNIQSIPFIINGNNTLPNILSISVPGVKAEVIVHFLEKDNIFIGTGSACSAKKNTFRLADAIGITRTEAEGTFRISFGKFNTMEEIEFAAKKFANAIHLFLSKKLNN